MDPLRPVELDRAVIGGNDVKGKHCCDDGTVVEEEGPGRVCVDLDGEDFAVTLLAGGNTLRSAFGGDGADAFDGDQAS